MKNFYSSVLFRFLSLLLLPVFAAQAIAAPPEYANWKVLRSGSLTESGQKFISLKVRHIQNPDNEKEEMVEVDYCNSNNECTFAHRIPKADFDIMVKKGTMGMGFFAVTGVVALFTMGFGAIAIAGSEKAINGPYYRVADLEYTLKTNSDLHSGGKDMDLFKRELDTAVRRYNNKYISAADNSSADNSAAENSGDSKNPNESPFPVASPAN